MNEDSTAAVDRTRRTAPGKLRAESRKLFRRLAALRPGTREHADARDALVELNLPLVHFVAGQYRSSPTPQDDLEQVGTIGLIKAVDGFDPDRGLEFTTYAVPKIRGEIQHYFRECGWAMHVPRRLQELRLKLGKATDELTQTCGRQPTTATLADHLGLDESEVREGVLAGLAYNTTSLDTQFDDQGDAAPALLKTIGAPDSALEKADNLMALKPMLERLDDRDRTILGLRFCSGMTQVEIGAEMGLSQVHVSRILIRTLARLRKDMLVDA
ncbi:SigB/SigF/SigG family RNA polymerase sigma factor [Actinacidiphila acidipaludis]|uniref:SigB/SigF/SigG family RNA polymerase sigma factor n=1 Tax=Actinacidiphila acidipaludis TaxID=2873382 RepID=A0ABS7PZL1_9ACTN|nr:SigB/SigF/SigG family RNA polymerase sigma factor [Streptomyces acidipaludis]MBY8876091.1 SigB/SigF/SigG family RNA polymerase sigma factor [Streptomyces acidipaludis]